jgi:hypothetical protein
MKLLILILTLTLTTNLYSQFNTGIGVGWSSKKSAILDLHAGYQIEQDFAKNVFFQGGFLSHISRQTDKGTIFNLTGGYNFILDDNENWSLQPAIGYYFHLKTTDDKLKNTSGLITSVYLLRYLREDGQIFLSTSLADKIFLTSFGCRFILKK